MSNVNEMTHYYYYYYYREFDVCMLDVFSTWQRTCFATLATHTCIHCNVSLQCNQIKLTKKKFATRIIYRIEQYFINNVFGARTEYTPYILSLHFYYYSYSFSFFLFLLLKHLSSPQLTFSHSCLR